MELTYYRHGDYLLPNMGLGEEDRQLIGKDGHMQLDYLRKERPGLYTRLLLSGELMAHLHEIERTCNERMALLIPQMKESEGITG